jgi:O-antigen/teichoic acid export membrane protein
VFQVLQIVILTRLLPREAFGLMALTLMVVNFSSIFVDMGLGSALLHRQKATKAEYSSLYWFTLLVAVAVYLLLVLVSPLVAQFYLEEELVRLIPLLGVILLLNAAGRQHRLVLQKDFKFSTIAKADLVSIFCGLAVAVCSALLGAGVYSLVISLVAVNLVANTWLLVSNVRSYPLVFRMKFQETYSFLKIGSYNMGSNLMDFFSRESDTLIIGKLLGTEVLGLYSLAKQLVIKVFNMLNPVMMNVLNPVLSSVQTESKRVKSLTLKSVSVIVAVVFPVYFLMAVFSKPLLYVLYGPEYVAGWIILAFLSVAFAVQSLYSPSGSLQIATGRTNIGLQWTLVQAALTPLVVLLVAPLGINMVALALAVLSCALIVPHWAMQYRVMAGITFSEYLEAMLQPIRYVRRPDFSEQVYRWVSTVLYEWLRRRSVAKSQKVKVDDVRAIPIVINNRNRHTTLKLLIDSLEQSGYRNIYIIDNQSTWPPLLEYYTSIPYQVIMLERNYGYNAFEKIPLYKQLRRAYFVYTDSDVVPTENCPADFMQQFLTILQQNEEVQKVGFSLKIDDLPSHFADRDKILEIESPYFSKPAGEGMYEAPIDTTFALHRPYALISTVGGYKMIRTGAPYEARHLPWYNNSQQLTAEEQYYIDHVEIGTQWSKGLRLKRESFLKRVLRMLKYY